MPLACRMSDAYCYFNVLPYITPRVFTHFKITRNTLNSSYADCGDIYNRSSYVSEASLVGT